MPFTLVLFIAALLLGLPALVGLAIYYQRKRRDAAPAMPVHTPPAPRPRPDLDAHLIAVARAFEDQQRFTNAARAVAEQLPISEAALLTNSFHQNPPVPPELVPVLSKYGVLGVWMDVCQNAILEVLFHYREQALPILYPIAFGPYDWTQYKAVHVLTRLADAGVQHDEVRSRLLEFARTTTDAELQERIGAWAEGREVKEG
ncbi:MAG: hypothetical protein JNL52_10640 [Flavobacteriales bacterium]|nr:hypothetical protein [Flavobacteriales bacterium]